MRGYCTALCVGLALWALVCGARPRASAIDTIRAAAVGDVDAVRRGLDGGVDLRANAGALLCFAAGSGDGKSIGLLLDRGADPDATLGGSTALMVATFRGNTAMVRQLLRAGADPCRRSGAGETPLDIARREGKHETANLLAIHTRNARPRCHAARQDTARLDRQPPN